QSPDGAQFLHVVRDRQRKWQWQRPCQSRDRPLLPLPRFQDAATRAQTLRPATTPGKSTAPAQALRYARSKAPAEIPPIKSPANASATLTTAPKCPSATHI